MYSVLHCALCLGSESARLILSIGSRTHHKLSMEYLLLLLLPRHLRTKERKKVNQVDSWIGSVSECPMLRLTAPLATSHGLVFYSQNVGFGSVFLPAIIIYFPCVRSTLAVSESRADTTGRVSCDVLIPTDYCRIRPVSSEQMPDTCTIRLIHPQVILQILQNPQIKKNRSMEAFSVHRQPTQ